MSRYACTFRILGAAALALLGVVAYAGQAVAVDITGRVLDQSGNPVVNAVVTLVFSDGTSLPTTSGMQGQYSFPNLTTPGRALRIEFSKQGVGYREYDQLSERTNQNIGTVLGGTPSSFGGIVRRQAEIEQLLTRRRFTPRDLSTEASKYLSSELLRNELKALRDPDLSIPRGAKEWLNNRTRDLESQLNARQASPR
jgi:hypothetical protein